MSLKFNGGNSPLQVVIDPGNSPPAPLKVTAVSISAPDTLVFSLSDGTTLKATGLQAALTSGMYVDQAGVLRPVPADQGVLPSDVTVNGTVYMAGATALPPGLSSNGGVIMTDGSVYFPGTFSNGGVLSVNPNASGA